MPNYLDVEPDQLRRLAMQHESLAADIRKWGEIPHDWLAEYQSTYGLIADQVRAALVDYYRRRHQSAERLAAKHERTRDELLAAAHALESADHSGKQQVSRAGDFGDGPSRRGPTPGALGDRRAQVDAGPVTTSTDNTQPIQSPAARSGDVAAITPADPKLPGHIELPVPAPAPSATSAPYLDGIVPTEPVAQTGTMPFSPGLPAPGVADVSWPTSVPEPAEVGGTVDSLGAKYDADTAGGAHGGADVGAAGMPAALSTAGPTQGPVFGSAAGPQPPTPLPTGPLAAALHAAEDRRALPSFVVGERVEDDLVLARTLLAAILSAVADSVPDLDWAVVVGRTPVGPMILLTSTEGRGWLPPGLFLPWEVAIPWRWDSSFRTAGRKAVAALEGTTDPARMLAEFGLLVGRRRPVRISALVSSTVIPDGLRATLDDGVAIEDRVLAAESAVDLASRGSGLVDRLALAGSDELLRQASIVPDTEILDKCIALANAAHAQVCAAAPSIGAEMSAHRARRQHIIDALRARMPVPRSWWEQMRAADDATAAALRARRVDVSQVPVGGNIPESIGTEAARELVFERRADELLLLLAEREPDRQTLRDALYSYGQIIEHPLFRASAVTGATHVTASRLSGLAGGRSAEPSVDGIDFVSVDPARRGEVVPLVGESSTMATNFDGFVEQRRS
ncbi:type VII secretion target [Nocardia beijingensis]|uniref:type VII secretion target n=1 Tax=Nocardia beijingensis TaxID=95162 RepID=UPI003318F3DD